MIIYIVESRIQKFNEDEGCYYSKDHIIHGLYKTKESAEEAYKKIKIIFEGHTKTMSFQILKD